MYERLLCVFSTPGAVVHSQGNPTTDMVQKILGSTSKSDDHPGDRGGHSSATPPSTTALAGSSEGTQEVPSELLRGGNVGGDRDGLGGKATLDERSSRVYSMVREIEGFLDKDRVLSADKTVIRSHMRDILELLADQQREIVDARYRLREAKIEEKSRDVAEQLAQNTKCLDNVRAQLANAQTQSVPKSFAQMVRTPVAQQEKKKPETDPIRTVVILPLEKSKIKNRAETRETIMTALRAAKTSVKVKASRPHGAKGMTLHLAGDEERTKLVKAIEGHKQIAVRTVCKKNPRLLVEHVGNSICEEDFLKGLYDQNFKEVCEEGAYKKFTRVITRMERGKHWVVETLHSCFRKAMKESRVYMTLGSHRVSNYCEPKRCMTCLRYGHTSRGCQEKISVCTQCSESGHSMKECPKRKSKLPPTCINCMRSKQRHTAHNALDHCCPIYMRAKAQEESRIDYGDGE